jgi:putative membrane protein
MAAMLLAGLVALLHLYFMYLEMIAWEQPSGRKAFGLTPEFAAATKALAANQGLYNGFLVAGLAWGLYLGREAGVRHPRVLPRLRHRRRSLRRHNRQP